MIHGSILLTCLGLMLLTLAAISDEIDDPTEPIILYPFTEDRSGFHRNINPEMGGSDVRRNQQEMIETVPQEEWTMDTIDPLLIPPVAEGTTNN